MRLLTDNKLTLSTTTITVNNENAAFPKANMLGNILVEKTAFDDNIVIDFGSAVTIDAVGFIAEDSGYTLQAHTSDSWGAPSFSQVITAEVTFINQTYRYWRLYQSSFSGFINHFYLGEYMQMPSFTPNTFRQINNNDISNTSQSGQVYTTLGITFKTDSFTFPGPSYTEYSTFETWYNSDDRVNHFMFVPYENDMTTIAPYFARLDEFEVPQDRDYNSIPFSINVREVK
jgi:hypothetical protein